MRTFQKSLTLLALLSFACGCGSSPRRPTLDQLTYFEAAQLVDVEQNRFDEINKTFRDQPEDAELKASMLRQNDRVLRALDLRDKAWDREKALIEK